MTFNEVLSQTIAMLQQHGRVSYRALKRQFTLDDAFLDDLKYELIEVQQRAVDQDGTILVWTEETGAAAAPVPTPATSQAQAPLAYTPAYLAEKILTSRSALEGERKQVTVLFADLKGSMELLADRDPEEARQLLDPVLERMMAAVYRYEGTVNQVMGDGIMALFGAPLAHEDHALRACYAALAMQAAIRTYAEEARRAHGITVQMRVGLNSGAVVVRAIDCFRQSVASLEGVRRRERFGQIFLPAVLSRAHLAVCHAELGMFTEGLVLGEKGLRIAEAVAHPTSLMRAYYGIGLLSLRQRDLRRTLPLLERAVGICQDADLPAFFPLMAASLGAAYTLSGRVAEAMPWLTQAMEQATATERADCQVFCRLFLGEAQMLAGRLEEAHALTEHALALTRTHQERGNQAYALRLLGEIAVHRAPPDVAQAAAHYRQALTLAAELGMRPLQAHCHLGLGTLYATAGQREQARAALTTAIEMYRAMDMTFWLPQTEAVLAQVDGH